MAPAARSVRRVRRVMLVSSLNASAPWPEFDFGRSVTRLTGGGNGGYSYGHKTVCHAHGEYARDEDGDGFCEVHVNTIEGFWSLLRSWLRPHRGISQDKLPLYLGFFQFVHNARRRGKALLGALVGGLVG